MGKQNRIRIGKRTIAILLAGILCLLSGVVIWYQNDRLSSQVQHNQRKNF